MCDLLFKDEDGEDYEVELDPGEEVSLIILFHFYLILIYLVYFLPQEKLHCFQFSSSGKGTQFYFTANLVGLSLIPNNTLRFDEFVPI